MSKKECKEKYINGLKGIACLFIMLGHFSGLYKYAQDVTAIDTQVFHIIQTFFSIFISESFWLRLFYVLSGYLVAKSVINCFGDLVRKSTVRFLRLALPIFGASVFILIISALFGIHNHEIQELVPNKWLNSFFARPLTFTGAFLEPFRVLFLGKCTFNSVWWVLKDMFFASLLVYCVSLIKNRWLSRSSIFAVGGLLHIF